MKKFIIAITLLFAPVAKPSPMEDALSNWFEIFKLQRGNAGLEFACNMSAIAIGVITANTKNPILPLAIMMPLIASTIDNHGINTPMLIRYMLFITIGFITAKSKLHEKIISR